MKSRVSIVLPMSRPEMALPVLESVQQLYFNPNIFVSIICVLDNIDVNRQEVEEKLAKIKSLKNLNRTSVYQFDREREGEFNSHQRRNRICQVMQQAATMVNDADFVVVLEDDGQIEPSYLESLLVGYDLLCKAHHVPKIGMLSGVEAGRWGFKMIGAWLTDNPADPTMIRTLPFTDGAEIYQEVDAAGFYCFITPGELFRRHTFSWHDECFGPDVVYGLSLRQQGYRNFIDWSINVIHVAKDRKIRVDKDCIEMLYVKIDDKWSLKK